MTPETRPNGTDGELELERELAALGRSIAYPPTPDLVTPVRAAIATPRPASAGWAGVARRPLRRSLVLALAALIAAAGIVAGAIYGIGGLRIVFVDRLPSVPPPATAPGPLGASLGLGGPTDLAKAKTIVTFTVSVPSSSAFATPDVVYFGSVLAGGQVSLVYGPGPGRPPPAASGVSVLVTEFGGAMEDKLAQKSVGPGTTVEVLAVNGGLGFWIEGQPHVLVYRDPTGFYAPATMRLVGNALAWEQDGTVIRIEGNLTRDEALALAATFVPAR
jgi:hypothetical protein